MSHIKSVITANHGVAPVLGQGTVRLSVSVHGLIKVVTVCDVLYVPDFMTNLLSVSKLADQGMPATFAHNQCVTGPRKAPFATAMQCNGLFCVQAEPASTSVDKNEGLGSVFVNGGNEL
jgi:hypothetical protein